MWPIYAKLLFERSNCSSCPADLKKFSSFTSQEAKRKCAREVDLFFSSLVNEMLLNERSRNQSFLRWERSWHLHCQKSGWMEHQATLGWLCPRRISVIVWYLKSLSWLEKLLKLKSSAPSDGRENIQTGNSPFKELFEREAEIDSAVHLKKEVVILPDGYFQGSSTLYWWDSREMSEFSPTNCKNKASGTAKKLDIQEIQAANYHKIEI